MSATAASRRLVPSGLTLESLAVGPSGLTIRAATTSARARCPACGLASSRVHSKYERTASDLPWRGISVALKIRVRKFFCRNRSCERSIFCERLSEVAVRARKTGRLEEALLAIALQLGGRAGARLASELGLLVGRDALLSRAKNVAHVHAEKVRVLGVDDFAFKKGNAYGTILVDLERRRVVDLLPECSQGSLVTWLNRHPGVEVATRDRSRAYKEAVAKGAPGAAQVADRWHLLHGLTLALEEFLLQKRSVLRDAVSEEEDAWSEGGVGSWHLNNRSGGWRVRSAKRRPQGGAMSAWSSNGETSAASTWPGRTRASSPGS